MARLKVKRIPFRRRREGKTNYKKRLSLLLSGKNRLVIRKSLKHIYAQIVEYNEKGDKVLIAASSRELGKFGWKYSCGNIPSAYLAGFLMGRKAVKKNVKDAVADIGLYSITKGNRLFACIKGAKDAGLNIEASEEIFPSEERVMGKHMADYRKMSGLLNDFKEVKAKLNNEIMND